MEGGGWARERELGRGTFWAEREKREGEESWVGPRENEKARRRKVFFTKQKVYNFFLNKATRLFEKIKYFLNKRLNGCYKMFLVDDSDEDTPTAEPVDADEVILAVQNTEVGS